MGEDVFNYKFNINFIVAFAIFYILGIIAFMTHSIPWIASILLVFSLFVLFKNYTSPKSIAIFYTIFVLAIVNCHFKIKNYDDLSSHLPTVATLSGIVETIPTTNNTSKTKFYLKVDSGIFDGIKVDNINAKTIVTIYDDIAKYKDIKIADRIQLTGNLRNPMTAKNPSQFDYAQYLKNHDTFSSFYVKADDWKIISAPQNFSGQFLQKLNDTRTKILERQSKYMKPNNLEVLGGIVFGDDAINPPDEIKNSFINSGLLHILAASGMNVSIIFGIWFFIGIRLRINYRLNILIGAILVAFYTMMTGLGPSVLRAALMIEFVLLGKLIDRDADSISLVFFVAFLMLLYNPAMVCDVGFQLSFVVTFALMYFCPPILENIKNKFLNFVAGSALIPFIAQLWASPIQMFYFNTYATYSVFANFVIVPFIMIISFLGFVGSILAMVPIDLFADFVCKSFAIILNPIVSILINISNYFASLPHSLITTIHPNMFQIILYYASLILIGYLIRIEFKSKKLFITFLTCLIILGLSFVKIPDKQLEIIVFDVGNADSFLIKTPSKKYLMIDTAHGLFDGSNATFSQADAIMNKYMKDNGIKTLDLLLLTHFDADHSGGAIDIMKSVNVKKLIWSDQNDNSKTSLALIDYVKNSAIKTSYAQNNQIVFNDKEIILKTFVPNIKNIQSDNDNSIISILSYGDFDMLFMADGGVLTFEKIKKDLKKNNIEILKSGHHGAKNTLNKEMLEFLNPDNVIISTGVNTYGHPHKETLKIIKDYGSNVYRTDMDNAIKIVANKRSYKIYKYNPSQKRFVKVYQAPNKI